MTDRDFILYERLCVMLRTAYHNELYYEVRLWWANFWNFTFEIAIAIGATGSSIAGWSFWTTQQGAYAWVGISSVATILALLKPIVSPGRILEHRSRQRQGWMALHYSSERLILSVRRDGEFPRDAQKTLDVLLGREAGLHLEDERCPKRRVFERIKIKVNEDITPESLCLIDIEDADRKSRGDNIKTKAA